MNLNRELSIVKKLFTTRLGQGGLVMVFGSFGVGFISFLLNPIMGIFLGPEGYGELLALLSLQLIFSVPALTLNTVLIKAAARYQAKGDMVALGNLFGGVTRKLVLLTGLVVGFFWLAKNPLAAFLQVHDSNLLILLGILTMVIFFFTVNGAILQGILRFEVYTIANLLNAILRVLLAVLLVYLGFGVGGAMGGLILGLLVAYLLGLFVLRKFLYGHNKANWGEIGVSATPAFVSLLGLTLLNNLDVVLVKHFFSPLETGIYGAAVIASRLIIFASLPITQVVFPVVTQRFEANQAFHHLVQYALFITFFIGVITSILYFFFPDLVLKIFFFSRSNQYAGAQNLLGLVGIFVTLYSINTLLTYLFLSLHKVKFALAPLVAGLIQGFLIWFYHDSLNTVIGINISINFALSLLLVTYYFRDKRKIHISHSKLK